MTQPQPSQADLLFAGVCRPPKREGHTFGAHLYVDPQRQGLRIYNVAYNGKLSLHESGLCGLYPWEILAALEVVDASRLTASRIATFGLLGLGMRKTQTVLVLAGTTWDRVLTTHTPRAQVIARLRSQAAHVPPLAALLEGRAAGVGEPVAVPDVVEAVLALEPHGEHAQPSVGLVGQLEALYRLKVAGGLNELEFLAAKQKLLG